MKHEEFISSLCFDIRLAEYDMKGSIAHTQMLSKCGIIDEQDANAIISELKKMILECKSGKLELSGEDVHYAVEKELIKRIGAAGGKMHTARSRNDQVVLDVKLYMKDTIKNQIQDLNKLLDAIITLAKKYKQDVMPGYTHLQEAQPVLFSHYILAYGWMVLRDMGRLRSCLDRLNENPLGSCALAGTSFPIDREMTAKMLDFSCVALNSIDAVSDRDFMLEYISSISILMMHMSRLAEDFIIWSSNPFGFVSLSDEYSSGSSIMPQKRNPDYLELLRAQSALVLGNFTALNALLKGLPLSYNRDLQDDKRVLFSTVDIFEKSITMVEGFLSTVKMNTPNMKKACEKGYLEATELANYLVEKNLPFRQSHTIVKQIVGYAMKNKLTLKEVDLKILKGFSNKYEKDVFKRLDPEYIISKIKSQGGTGLESVNEQISKLLKLKKEV